MSQVVGGTVGGGRPLISFLSLSACLCKRQRDRGSVSHISYPCTKKWLTVHHCFIKLRSFRLWPCCAGCYWMLCFLKRCNQSEGGVNNLEIEKILKKYTSCHHHICNNECMFVWSHFSETLNCVPQNIKKVFLSFAAIVHLACKFILGGYLVQIHWKTSLTAQGAMILLQPKSMLSILSFQNAQPQSDCFRIWDHVC